MEVKYTGGGLIVWDMVRDNISEEKKNDKDTGMKNLEYSLFEDLEFGKRRRRLYGFPYLKYLIEIWPGDLEIQYNRMNDDM